MADLNVSMIVRLLDKASGPLGKIIGRTRDLGAATQRAGRADLAAARASSDALRERQAAARGGVLEAAAIAYALKQAAAPAIAFETAMAGVGKTVGFDAADGLAAFGRDILALSTDLPIAADGIAAIAEAAGQSGVVAADLADDLKRAELAAFAVDAARMGVAFDISARDAGQAMAQWRVALGLTRERALALGDAVNHLSNNMNLTAASLVDVIRRQGAVAMTAGLAETEVAALGAAMLNGGAAPEVAATALKNFVSALTRGEAATRSQSEAFSALGLNATDMARRMQTDARGAIIDVMERLSQADRSTQGALMTRLFGEESIGAIAPLLRSFDKLRQAFALAGDEAGFAGSMTGEYAVKARTTENQIRLLSNSMTRISIVLGSELLPHLNDLARRGVAAADAVTGWAEANPELTGTLVKAVAAIAAFKVASGALRWAFAAIVGPFVRARLAFAWLAAVALPGIRAGAVFVATRALPMVGRAFAVLARLFVANPIGAAIALIGAAAYLLWENWSQVSGWIRENITGPLGDAFDWLNEKVMNALGPLREWFGLSRGYSSSTQAGSGAFFNPDPPPLPEARASGGAVRAGSVYAINERGQELFAPGLSGSIISARSAAAALGAGAADRIDAGRPPARTGPGAGVSLGGVTINIAAPAGAGAQDIADAVRRALSDALRDARMGGLHDGATLAGF